jgi:hypothetical protein
MYYPTGLQTWTSRTNGTLKEDIVNLGDALLDHGPLLTFAKEKKKDNDLKSRITWR